jgi:glucuronokinase
MRERAVMRRASGVAYARVGLLGNPSDGYGGQAIAFSLYDFRARVAIQASDRFALCSGPSDLHSFACLRQACRAFSAVGCEDGIRLLRAAILGFAGHAGVLECVEEGDPRLRFEMRYETDIPRQVGLSGSSAIVIAALRALMAWFEVEIEPAALAELALAAEVRDLRIPAGPMDRVVQAYEGVMRMDLCEPRSQASYTRMDPACLPPLFVAWDPRAGQASSVAHGELRARWQSGDPELRRVMQSLRELVDAGTLCLERGDRAGFCELVNRNFELRSRIFDIAERDREMIAIARGCGAAAKLCGSGGAVVGVLEEEFELAELERVYRHAGFYLLRPELAPGASSSDQTP